MLAYHQTISDLSNECYLVDVLMHHVSPGEYVDMVKAGIIDPVKVIRTAFVDAAR